MNEKLKKALKLEITNLVFVLEVLAKDHPLYPSRSINDQVERIQAMVEEIQ